MGEAAFEITEIRELPRDINEFNDWYEWSLEYCEKMGTGDLAIIVPLRLSDMPEDTVLTKEEMLVTLKLRGYIK